MSWFRHEHKWKLHNVEACKRNHIDPFGKALGTDDASIFLYYCECGEHMTKVLDGVWQIKQSDSDFLKQAGIKA